MLNHAEPGTGAGRRMSHWQRFLIIDVKSGARDMPSVRPCVSIPLALLGPAGTGWYRLVP